MTNGYVGKTFSPETLQLLFSAINEDDLVDENVSLPQRIDVQCTQDSLKKHLSRLWFSKTTVLLGKLQDAFRNSNIRAVK
ncbi:hypothetical protein [Erwinia sp. MYb416]|uniref:hypothetical protein n=1 Tax=Erwinia sp. MYb416 TaxID=3108532 RepID=UPI0030AB8190